MILYDGLGRPVDVKRMIEHYAKQGSTTTTDFEQGEGDWNLRGSATATNAPTEIRSLKFELIDSSTSIQEIGNKEARFGETLYYLNPDTGELYKKYVDFMTGQLHIESAKFTKGQTATPLLTVDALHDIVLGMAKELEELKGRVLDSDNQDNSRLSVGVVQQEHQTPIQSGNIEDSGNRHSVQSGATILGAIIGGDGTGTV